MQIYDVILKLQVELLMTLCHKWQLAHVWKYYTRINTDIDFLSGKSLITTSVSWVNKRLLDVKTGLKEYDVTHPHFAFLTELALINYI